MARAISISRSVSRSFANQFCAAVIDSSQTSMIERSATVTARYSGLSRFPLQTGHGRRGLSRSVSARMNSDSASPWRRPRDLRADELGLGFAMARLEIGEDAFVRRFVPAALPLAVEVLHAQGIAVVAMENNLPLFDGQLPERLFHRGLFTMGDRLDEIVIEVGRPPQGPDRAIGERPAFVRDHQVGIDLELTAEPRARRASAMRVVERKIT